MTIELTTTELMPTTESTTSTDLPERRVVLLGASNLIRGISIVVETAWREIMSAWGDTELPLAHHSPSLARWLSLRLMRPAQRRLCGLTQTKQQPATRLTDGTRVSLY